MQRCVEEREAFFSNGGNEDELVALFGLPALRFEHEGDVEGAARYRAYIGARLATFRQALESLAKNSGSRQALSETIRTLPAVFWECVPVSSDTLDSAPFEFVLLPANPRSWKGPDPGPFSSHLSRCGSEQGAIAFDSLGKDSRLIVPCSVEPVGALTHLGVFVRDAPVTAQGALWKLVAEEALTAIERAKGKKVWLSTSGLGVSWLHVRLDTRAKYYHTQYYARM